MDSPETRLARLQLSLPPAPTPMGLYKPALIVHGLLYVSGHVPLRVDGTRITGRLGADLDLEAGRLAARQAGLAMLATVRGALGSLDRVERLVKLLGLVNCTPEFSQHPAVINGCSELFVEIFGEDRGVGVRSAAGANALPGNVAVEVEAIFAISA